MEKVAIITSGFLPVPATKGGAVENLIVNLLKENEKKNNVEFNIISIYDDKANNESKKYSNAKFNFIKVNLIVKLVDNITFIVAKKILKKKNSQSYRYIFQRLFFLNKCSRILKENNFDKIILENHPTQFLTLKWRRNYIKYKGKYFYHCHNEFSGTYNCLKIIKNTEKIICVSKYIANTLSAYLEMPPEKFCVLRNCIDFNKFNCELSKQEKLNLRKKYNIKPNTKVLLFTGRIVPEKGVKELILALKNVKHNNYKLLIIGSSLNLINVKTDYQVEVENLIKELNEKIIFTGFINYDDIYKFYRIADIAVIPSIWNDPAPLTIIESLVCGLPIITTNSGGIPEYATNGSAIIINRNENLITNLANEIDKLLDDEEQLRNMQKISKSVSLDLNIDNYYKNFNDIIK